MSAISDSSVEECRALLEADDQSLNRKFRPVFELDGGSIECKIELLQTGVLALAMDIIRKDSSNHIQAIAQCWSMFINTIPVGDYEDGRHFLIITHFAQLGGIALLNREMQRRVAETGQPGNLMNTCGWCASVDEVTPLIIKEESIHKLAIKIVNIGDTKQNVYFPEALGFLGSACACVSVRAKLRQDGALDAAIPHLDGLNARDGDDAVLKRGLVASGIIARLAGSDESGVGPRLLRGNPLLIGKTLNFLDDVLNAGSNGIVLNIRMNPRRITMDLLTIATSDVNKPLLKDAIPILVKALKLRGENNAPMVVDILNILLQLARDKECSEAIETNKKEICTLLQNLVVAPKYNAETVSTCANFQQTLLPQGSFEKGLRGLGGLLSRKVM